MTRTTTSRRHRPVTRLRAGLMAVTAGLAVTLTACGGGDDQSADQTEPVDIHAAPTDVHWSTVGGIKVPTADQGPSDKGEHGSVSGFDHTPVGAGLAAMNQPTRAAVAPEGDWSEAAAAGIAPGPGRDIYLNNRAGVKATGKTADEFTPTMQGWRITDYAADAADVEVYSSYSDDSKSVTTYRMVWSADDWKVELPADGQGSVKSVDDYPDDMVKVSSK